MVANFYGVNPRNLQRQYKDYLSDFKQWNQKPHAKKWLLYYKNIGGYISIDETAFSNGDLYTTVTNQNAQEKKGTLITIIKGTKVETVVKIPLKQRKKVKEVTLDMAGNMG